MLRLEVIFCLLFVNNCRGSAHFLTCPEVTQDTASCESVESWLCGSSDWLGSMVEWKDTVEEVCSKEDLGAQWEELFSCPDTVTVECVNETATSCGNDPFNCTICYCHDGKYKDRQNYLRLWKKHQEIFRKSMMFYKEKIKFCGQRTACTETDEVTTTMETTDTTQQLPTDNTTTTDTTTIETTTVASTTIETTTEGPCQFITGDVCYWIYYNRTEEMNFTQAEQICAKNGSVPGYFPTRQIYNETLQKLRSMLTGDYGCIWTGIKINPITADVTYPYTEVYMNWRSISLGWSPFTSIYLCAWPRESMYDGMGSISPDTTWSGVLCQYSLN